MTRAEITAKLDEIIEFSGCEMYIDTPTKRYSSGMTVRLAFAVAAHLEPDILVVDEVLAVGDAEFQKKAIGKMQDISTSEGRTVLFVSHNMAAVKSLCTRAIVLQNGETVFEGQTNDAVDFYLHEESDKTEGGSVNFIQNSSGDGEIEIVSISTSDFQGRVRSTFLQSESIIVSIEFKVKIDLVKGMRFNLTVKNTSQVVAFSTSSHDITQEGIAKGLHRLQLTIPSYLLNNTRYILMINAGIPGAKILIEPLDVLNIDIEGDYASGSTYIEKWPGLVSPKIEWKLNEAIKK